MQDALSTPVNDIFFIYFTIRYPSEQKQEEKAISHHTYMYILLNSVY